MPKKRNDTEARVRRIIREELSGINASLELDPIYNASESINRLEALLSQPDNDVNIVEVRREIYSLKDLLPEIVEEINIIRDTFSD